ncbi:MAG: hypothetical protein COA66_00105 [Arcobacter sp.]|nr:MAG: hypothetical protein COA66_00105 [Arcobacter sp.]
MKNFILISLFSIILFTGCSQMPREAVELSVTVGRDLSIMKKSHIALVDLYYKSLIKDINNFIDKVYLPYNIQKTLSDKILKNELLTAIELASKDGSTKDTQVKSIEKIEAFLLIIQEEVEFYRKLKLKPIEEQYKTVLLNINKSYEQIHYANSIVTGHLASVAKVHETQNEILEKFDIKDLRVNVGNDVAELSDKIAKLMIKAENGNEKFSSIVEKFEKVLKK